MWEDRLLISKAIIFEVPPFWPKAGISNFWIKFGWIDKFWYTMCYTKVFCCWKLLPQWGRAARYENIFLERWRLSRQRRVQILIHLWQILNICISFCCSQAEQHNVRTSFWRGFPKSTANHQAQMLTMPPKYAFGILTSGPCGKAKVHKARHLKNSRLGLSWLPSWWVVVV